MLKKVLLGVLATFGACILFVPVAFIAVIARESVMSVGKLHWLAGVTVAILWLLGIGVLCFLLSRAWLPSASPRLRAFVGADRKPHERTGWLEQHPVASQILVVFVAILTAVFVLTAMSTLLEEQGIATYTEAKNGLPKHELLFRFYVWHVVDMIPLLDLPEVYDWEPPIRGSNFLAQSIALGFRVGILSVAISAVASVVNAKRRDRNA